MLALRDERHGRTGIVATVVVVGMILATGYVAGRHEVSGRRGLSPARPADQGPLPGGRQVESISIAASQVGHVVYSASKSEGKPASGVWVDDGGIVAEAFQSGLSVLTEPTDPGSPKRNYEEVVAEAARDSVYITSVSGGVALGVEPNTDQLKTNPGLVRFQLGDYSVVVSAPGMSVEQLIHIAESLRPVGEARG